MSTVSTWEPTATPGVYSNGTSYMVRWMRGSKRRSRTFPSYERALEFQTSLPPKAKGGGLSADPERAARSLANLKRHDPLQQTARALHHGGYAGPRVLPVAGKARGIYELLSEEAPLRDARGNLPAADRTAVELLALSLARVESVANWLELHGLLDPDTGEPRSAVDLERRLRIEARDHAESLGLSPRSRAQLGLDLVRGLSAAERLEQHLREHYGDDSDVVEGQETS